MKIKNLLLTAILIILSLIGGSSAEAQIIYTDVIPDTIVSVTDSMYHLDLNNDGITDFDLTYTYDQAWSMDCGSLSQTIISIASIDSNAVLSDSTNLTLALSCPASIDSNAVDWSYTTPLNLYNYTEYCYGSDFTVWQTGYSITGSFGLDSCKYVGLKFHFGGENYFGWVQLFHTGSTLKVKDYAYNSSPNQPILAGTNNNPYAILPSTYYCAGDSIALAIYTSNYVQLNAGNYFIAQLSDSAGTFNNPTLLDSIQSTNAVIMHTVIPTGLYPSIEYNIRIITTDSAVIGNATTNFTINRLPIVMFTTEYDTICMPWTNNPHLNVNLSGPCFGCYDQWYFDGAHNASGYGLQCPLINSGIYTVDVTNACGVSSLSDTIFVMPLIYVTIPDYINVCIADMPLTLNVASPTGGIYSCSGHITGSNIFNAITLGDYWVNYQAIDSHGCLQPPWSLQIHVTSCSAGVSDNSNINTIDIYPIPTTGIMNLSEPANISLCDLSGKLLLEEKNTNQLDISALPAGMYFLSFGENNNQIVKVIKE